MINRASGIYNLYPTQSDFPQNYMQAEENLYANPINRDIICIFMDMDSYFYTEDSILHRYPSLWNMQVVYHILYVFH